MLVFYIGITSIILIVIITLYLIAKILKAPKLFIRALLSFIFLLSILAIIFFALDIEFESPFHQGENSVIPNHSPYALVKDGELVEYKRTFAEATAAAEQLQGVSISYERIDQIIFDDSPLPHQAFVQRVPLISQLPELPRGCEVTSLAMILQFNGVYVDKLTLAEEIKKDPTPYSVVNGIVHFGNPNDGFVGDMYTYDNPGYGVYVGPVYELANNYTPNQVLNMTGLSFEYIKRSIARGRPVWVIIHTKFGTLPKSSFETWKTPTGEISITYHQHAVVVTGYDQDYIYFNDPLTNERDRPILTHRFIEAWEQMGSQAISILN